MRRAQGFVSVMDEETDGKEIERGPSSSELATVGQAPDRLEEKTEVSENQDNAVLRATIAAQRWEIKGLREQLQKTADDLEKAVDEGKHLERVQDAEALQRARDEAEAAVAVQAALATTYKRLLERLQRIVFADLWTAFHRPAGGADLLLKIIAIWQSGLFDEAYYRGQCGADEIPEGMPAIAHYVLHGEAALRDPHPLFQVSYYRARRGPLPESASVLLDYVENGAHLPPNPLFDPAYYLRQHRELAGTGINPLVHYVSLAATVAGNPHPLFDVEYYCSRIAAAGGTRPESPLAHYLTSAPQAPSPHPLFDAEFYLSAHPEAGASGMPPLVHYVTRGDRRGWDPHRWFDTRHYRRTNPDVAESGVNTLAHFVVHGAAEGRSPHPAFDCSFYRSRSPDVARREPGHRTLVHFLSHGIAEGRSPHPLVDLSHIRGQLHGKSLDAGGLWELLYSRRAVIRRVLPSSRASEAVFTPHWLFDSEYYMRMSSDAREHSDGPLIYYLTTGWRLDQGPHPLFDPVYYRAQAAERGHDIRDPLAHFVMTGARLGLSPHPLFDSAYYVANNPDVAANDVNPLQHYLTNGDFEGRNPNPLFSPAYYRSRAGGDLRTNALLHYLEMGGTGDPHELFDTEYYLSQLPSGLPAETTPLAHYLGNQEGMRASPFPLFDQDYVRDQLPPEMGEGVPLLAYYLSLPAEEAPSPHPAFDRDFYHGTVGYFAPALLEYVATWRGLGRGGYQLHKLHFHEASAQFCSISYLLDHPELLDGSQVPMVDYVRRAGWPIKASGRVGRSVAAPSNEGALSGWYQPAEYLAGRLEGAAEEQLNRGLGRLTKHELFSSTESLARDTALAALWETVAPHATVAADDRRLMLQVEQSRRLAVYAIHAEDGQLKSYHKAVLSELAAGGYATIIVNSTMGGAAALADGAADKASAAIVRTGEGRDFASWIVATTYFAPVLRHVDHMLFLNDSLIGPFGPLQPVLQAMEEHPADFKGLTESLEVTRHLQSSCFMLSRHALFSRTFLQFIADFSAACATAGSTRARSGSDRDTRPSVRHAIVGAGELRLSTRFMSTGIGSAALSPYRALVQAWLDRTPGQIERACMLPARFAGGGEHTMPKDLPVRVSDYLVEWLLDRAARLRAGEWVNPQHIFWDLLLAGGDFPFIKKELLLTNPLHVPTIVALPELLSAGGLEEGAKLLDDLVPRGRSDTLPPCYFRLSSPLLDTLFR